MRVPTAHKVCGVISFFLGLFGATTISMSLGEYLGPVVGLALLFVVGFAHNWIFTGKV